MIIDPNMGVIPVLGWVPGPPEIIIILIVVLLLFGGKKLPELARGLARGLRTFKNELRGIKEDLDLEDEPSPPPAPESKAPDQEQAPESDHPEQGPSGERTQEP